MSTCERRVRRFLKGLIAIVVAVIVMLSVWLLITLHDLRDALRAQADAWGRLADVTAKQKER